MLIHVFFGAFFRKNIRSPTFQVKATAGDTHLGGEDFDNRPLVIIYVIIYGNISPTNIMGVIGI